MPLRKLHQHVARREGDVQEEGEVRLESFAAQVVGDVEELVVVDPDEVVFAAFPGQCLSELAVHFYVGVPIFRIEIAASLKIVEERPEDLIGVAVIVLVDLVLAQ